MKKLSFFLLALPFWAVTALYSPQSVQAELTDRIVAVVNDDIITQSDIDTEGREVFKQISRQVPAEEQTTAMNKVRRDILSSLIDKKLIEQRGNKLGLQVLPEEIDRAFEHNLARSGMRQDELVASLIKRGTSLEKYKESMKWEILKMKLVNYEIQSKIVIPEEKIKEYYAANYQEPSTSSGEGYYLLHIGFLMPEENGSEETVRAHAEEVRQMAVSGQNFQGLAQTYSDLPSGPTGGDIGVVGKHDLAANVASVLAKLKPGEISPLLDLQSGKGFQFFKLVSLKDANTADQSAYESLRTQLVETLQEKEMKVQFEKWVKKLREDAYIKELE